MLLRVNRRACENTPTFNLYLQRHQLYPPQILNAPGRDLGLIVVIPCYDEPKLTETLDTLLLCKRPHCHAEIIVVINASGKDPARVHAQNERSFNEAKAWVSRHQNPKLSFYVLLIPDMPEKVAGVGLARKIGMDEAVVRFHMTGNRDGIIASLDADCVCDTNYLTALETHFMEHPETPACSIYFEHLPDQSVDGRSQEGINAYELFLRYYIHGLRYSRFPHAFHTIGSCFAVRSSAYEAQGGMNRRQAGEDFYFLHKIIPLGGFTELRRTTVFPSGRVSRRVPYGTGRVMETWLNSDQDSYLVYSAKVFHDMKALFTSVEQFFDVVAAERMIKQLSEPLIHFLGSQNFLDGLAEIRQHTSSLDAFEKRFFRWFNAFRTLKFVHFATERYYPKVAVEKAAASLLACQGLLPGKDQVIPTSEQLLHHFRDMDRSGIRMVMKRRAR